MKGKTNSGQFEVSCRARAQSVAWAFVTVQQGDDSLLEKFAIVIDPDVPDVSLSVNLDPLASASAALCYIASYSDLISALGDNAVAGRQHFSDHGHDEGRTIIFRPFDYAASHPDLFGLVLDPAASARHFITSGHKEGRPIYFDAYLYGAGYPDLAAKFGDNQKQLALHYVEHGFSEGRHCANFDWQKYLEQNPGVFRSASAAARHFLKNFVS